MNARKLIKNLSSAGVHLWIDGNLVNYSGPEDVLGNEVLKILKEHKQEIFQVLQHIECFDCEHAEYIESIGTGCKHIVAGYYQRQWTALDKLQDCPKGYWN